MAFNHKSLPSKIYAYGALAPVENAALVDEQMRLGHQYYNLLIEIERERRARIEQHLRDQSPEFATARDAEAALQTQLETARDAIKRGNQAARGVTVTEEQKAAILDLVRCLKEAGAVTKGYRKAAWKLPAMKELANRAGDAATDRRRDARAVCGVFWGTYLIVEAAADQAAYDCRNGPPPYFHSFRGNGTVAVQIQKSKTLNTAALLAGNDSRVRVEILPRPGPITSNRGRRRRHCLLWLRVGTVVPPGRTRGRDPIWAKIPFLLHRDLPADAEVKWVKLFRMKVAEETRWEVQFTLSKTEWVKTGRAAAGAVGIDVGWRKLADGSVRVAYWVGDDGAEGQLVLSARDVGRWHRADSLQSTRKDNFNAVFARLLEWVTDFATACPLPDWWATQAEELPRWRSEGRLVGLCKFWNDHRFPGDEAIFADLWAWRLQDRHLHSWEDFQRRRALNWRQNLYRNFVNGPPSPRFPGGGLCRRYRTAAVENVNWAEMMRTPEPEENYLPPGITTFRRMASVGELIRCIKEGFAENVPVPAGWTTQTCAPVPHGCGQLDEFNAAAELVRTCASCGNVMDQDKRAALNLLGGLAVERARLAAEEAAAEEAAEAEDAADGPPDEGT